MAAFKGFAVVQETLRRESRDEMVNLAILPDRIERMATTEYLHGTDISTGRPVRAMLSTFRSWDGRPSLQARLAELGENGGTIVLSNCKKNRNGTWEVSNATTFPHGSPVLTDGVMRVSAASRREDGRWSQSMQHLRTGRAIACATYSAVVEAIYAALSDEGPGRAGAIVRGWHPVREGAMGFEVGLVFDPGTMCYLDADDSYSGFLASPDIWVAGLGARASGDRCMEIVGQLIDQHPEEIVWEVIPKRTYSLGGFIAESAGLRTGRDPSAPYRFADTGRGTGCMPSIVGFVRRDGVLWPRMAIPQRFDIDPVQELRVPTARVRPSQPVARTSAPTNAAHVRTAPASRRDPLADVNAPAPLPPDLVLPRLAAAGHDAPDFCSPDGVGTQDVAALSMPDATPAAPGRTF